MNPAEARRTIDAVIEARELAVEADDCPECDGPQCDDHGLGACAGCEIFQCRRCARWVSWDVGGADDWPGLCAICWCVQEDPDSNPCGLAYPTPWLEMMSAHVEAGWPTLYKS